MTFDPASWTLPATFEGLPWPDLWASLLLFVVLWVSRMNVIQLVRIRTSCAAGS
jgi:hypothetical protein